MSIADQANNFFAKFLKPIIGLVILAIVVGGVSSYRNKQKLAETESRANELFILKKELQVARENLDKEMETAAPKVKAKGKAAKAAAVKKAEPKPEQLKAVYEPIVAKFETYIKSNQGHVTAVEGALLVSQAIEEYKDDEQILKVLQLGVQGADKSNFLYGVAQTRVGELLEKQDKCTEAAKAWEDIMNVKTHAYMAESLRLKSGVCYEKVGMLDKAEQLYKKVVDASPDTSQGRMAKKFLMYIKYKKTKTSKKTDDTSAMNSK